MPGRNSDISAISDSFEYYEQEILDSQLVCTRRRNFQCIRPIRSLPVDRLFTEFFTVNHEVGMVINSALTVSLVANLAPLVAQNPNKSTNQ